VRFEQLRAECSEGSGFEKKMLRDEKGSFGRKG
jgi:hypothetical protein